MTMQTELLNVQSSDTLATTLTQRLAPVKDTLADLWHRHPIAHLTVDDVLPTASAHWLSESFPPEQQLCRVRSLCKSVYVSRSPADLSEPLDGLTRALQAPAVIRLLSEITAIRELSIDRSPAAGGLLSLGRGDFENPHLEASHCPQRDRYCVLKAIFYLSPDWRLADGGQLELWEDGLDGLPTVTLAKFNRLTLVAMNDHSWHSINRVSSRRPRRALIQKYYAPQPLSDHAYQHERSFRGRPDQALRDLVLRYAQSLPSSLPRNWIL